MDVTYYAKIRHLKRYVMNSTCTRRGYTYTALVQLTYDQIPSLIFHYSMYADRVILTILYSIISRPEAEQH
jgi:hypothetical protein